MRSPGGTLRVVGEDPVNRSITGEGPQGAWFGGEAESGKGRTPDQIPHAIDGIADRDSEAVLGGTVRYGRDPVNDLPQVPQLDLAPVHDLRAQAIELVNIVEQCPRRVVICCEQRRHPGAEAQPQPSPFAVPPQDTCPNP